jgi:hypothetical protein
MILGTPAAVVGCHTSVVIQLRRSETEVLMGSKIPLRTAEPPQDLVIEGH